MSRIVDCSLFYNEFDLLSLRLKLLYDHVDEFVLVESTHTFQGNPKSTQLKDEWDRFSHYHDKMRYVLYDEIPSDNAWENDYGQRNAIMQGLHDAHPDDIIIIGDADEIVRPCIIQQMKDDDRDIMGFRTPYFNFKYNYMLINDPEAYCVWITACKKKLLDSPQKLRDSRFNLTTLPYNYDDGQIKMYEHAGWHFTYLGDDEFIRNKIRSFAHTELNYPEFIEQIDVQTAMENGKGFNPLDPRTFVPVKYTDYFPDDLPPDFLISGEFSPLHYLPKD